MRWIRALLALVLMGFVGLLCQSCVDLLDLDGYQSAIRQLCDKLAQCEDDDLYPDCIATAEARLAASDVTTRGAFLTGFADKNCLENCTNARKCLDADPICFDSGQDCGTLEQCCGFSSGFGVCQADRCCIPGGAPCAGGGCCDLECIDNTCGGFECVNLGQPCAHNGECCGELRCNPVSKKCLECQPDDAKCKSGADCCSGHCALFAPEEGVCAPKPCGAPLAAACSDDEDCCDGFCVEAPALGHSVCSTGECLPIGVLCERDDTCCSGRCNPNFGCESACMGPTLGESCSGDAMCCEGICDSSRCCLPDGAPCDDEGLCCAKECHGDALGEQTCGPPPSSNCSVTGGTCLTPGDCCNSADCEGGTCCKIVNMPCSHDLCVVGDPLDPTCSSLADPEGSCIAEICEQDPYCCCTAWDQGCKEAVVDCGVQCPSPTED